MIMQLLQLIVMGDFIYHYVQWYGFPFISCSHLS